MMKMTRFLIWFGVIFMQVAASLTCFIVLYTVGAIFFTKVAMSLISLWLLVFAGAFDLAVYFAKAIRAPLRCPDNYVPNLVGLAWIKPFVSLPLGLAVIGILGRWCVGPSNFRIR